MVFSMVFHDEFWTLGVKGLRVNIFYTYQIKNKVSGLQRPLRVGLLYNLKTGLIQNKCNCKAIVALLCRFNPATGANLQGHNDSRTQVKVLHEASVKLLDIVYIKYREIYNKLCMAAMGEDCIGNDRQKLAVLANDLMLLAVSVIGAASYIIHQSTSDMVSGDVLVSGVGNSPLTGRLQAIPFFFHFNSRKFVQ